MDMKTCNSVLDGIKVCPACHTAKPLTEYHKGRGNHPTSWCKKCRKSYSAEYRKRPEVKDAALAYSREYRKNPENRIRLNEATRRCRKTLHAKAIRNEYRKLWTAKEKQKAVQYKGGKCVCCGYNFCLAAMDFHHLNPAEKEGYGTGALIAHRSFEKNKPEIDKCVLLCVRCHREIHAGARVL